MADFLFDLLAVPRQEKKYRMHDIDSTNFSEDELKSRFRFGRDSIIFLVELLREDLEQQTSRNHALSPAVQVLVALRFFASGSFLQVIGDTVGLPKFTVSRTIRDVSAALIYKQNEFIHWPTTVDEIQQVKEGFFHKGGFPGVIGCVDGTHIRLQCPSQNEADYVNHKGYHSINVEAICDHRGEKLEIFLYYFLGEHMLSGYFLC
ncbi:putative nuclease HARBI1 [Montipora capricornis]|uniref:putative nuclease HARBI1 n=1 Tax=Montipora capricornis TaxID=246305 RepID=UPI0035F1DE6B